MRIIVTVVFCLILCSFHTAFLCAEELPAFRTDDNPDKSLPWYQVQPGVFPPEGSAHYFSGELIQVDHLNRKFVLRVDRTDAQNRSHWDLPVGVGMLPYGSIYHHGAPAALEDIPLGTHLHGLFYARDPKDKSKPLDGWYSRVSIEGDFNRCIRLEDDFSFHARQNQLWRIEEINTIENKLTAILTTQGETVGDRKSFDLNAVTRYWKGRSVGELADLAVGDLVQMNITWATLYGPGRIRDIWIDEQSRNLATDHQTQRHRLYMRERGLPGWVTAVDNQARIVTVTLFAGSEPSLFDALVPGEAAGLAVAEDNLLMHDPVNDRKRGPILGVEHVSPEQGGSGIQIRIRPDLLLEGYRPNRVVRIYPASWSVIALPKEEQLFGR